MDGEIWGCGIVCCCPLSFIALLLLSWKIIIMPDRFRHLELRPHEHNSSYAMRFHHSWQAPLTFKFYFWSFFSFFLRMTHILISASKHMHIGKDPSNNGQWGLWSRMRAILETDVTAAILMMLISMVINREVARFISVNGLQTCPSPIANSIQLIVQIFKVLNEKILHRMHMVTKTICPSRQKA